MSEPHISASSRRKWLLRLIGVRIVVFTIFAARQPNPDTQYLMTVVIGLSVFWYALLRWNKWYVFQAYAQMAVDLLLITWGVNRTGGPDSYFSSLYFLEIVTSSIILEREGAFITAMLSSILHFAHLDLAYFGWIPSTAQARGDLSSLQYMISLSIFGFCSVGFLSNYLAESWRRTGVALAKSTGRIAFLEEFSDSIVHSMGSGLITTDVEGRIYLFNRAAEYITGRTQHVARRMTIWEMFPGITSRIESSKFDMWTKQVRSRDIFLRFSVTPVMIDDQNTAGFVWCFNDLTELRVLERQMRQKEQMAAIGAMSAGIAHEIRNPLASITGSFNLLQSELELNTDQRQLVDIITRETERLNRTITEFLNYARPISPKLQEVNLAELISETMRLMKNSPEVRPTHTIETELESISASVDESMMRQVLYNLATNALKAMPTGGQLVVSLAKRNDGAQIRFSDTGIGLSDEELRSLFVPFHSSFRNGTGLGLPIVYQIVTAHNGTIGVKSRKGVGTTFFVEL